MQNLINTYEVPTHWMIALHVASLGIMTGVIVYVQVVHYPLFSLVPSSAFIDFHRAHSTLTTWVVAPTMAIELLTAIALCVLRPSFIPAPILVANLVFIGITWFSTALIQVPLHHQLATAAMQEQRLMLINTLVSTNWIRTVAWGLRSIAWTIWLGFVLGKSRIVPLVGLVLIYFSLLTAAPVLAASPNTSSLSLSWLWGTLPSLAGSSCTFKGHSNTPEKHSSLPTVIVVTFHPKEQKIVNTWLDALAHKAHVLEVPVLEPHWLKVKPQATHYMKGQVNKQHHGRVCPLYQPHTVVANQLGLSKNLTGAYVFLVAHSSSKCRRWVGQAAEWITSSGVA